MSTSPAITTDGRSRVLADGTEMPLLGLGVWQVPDGPECEQAVRWALEAGYRHIDTAQAYGNEESVGRALRDSGIDRAEVFLATKFMPAREGDPALELEESLRRLGVDGVDLYLVHWPAGGPTWAWPGMERALAAGHAGAIGVSNFSLQEIDEVTAVASSPPLVDQVELSPFRYRAELLAGCAEREIAVESYSTLGTGRHLADPQVVEVARQAGRTAAQVLLRWAVQRGVPVIPKSVNRERIVENGQLFDFELSAGQMDTLDALDETGGTAEARESKWWR